MLLAVYAFCTGTLYGKAGSAVLRRSPAHYGEVPELRVQTKVALAVGSRGRLMYSQSCSLTLV